MAPLNTILVAYDADPPAQRALRRAVELGTLTDAKVVVLRVAARYVSVLRSIGPLDPLDRPWQHAEQLERTRRELWGQVDWQFLQARGDPAEVIVRTAASCGADLIVLGAGTPNMLKRVLRQSVSEVVAQRADCDVLVVH